MQNNSLYINKCTQFITHYIAPCFPFLFLFKYLLMLRSNLNNLSTLRHITKLCQFSLRLKNRSSINKTTANVIVSKSNLFH